MTNNLPPRVVTRRGMTLLELTVVISLLLALVAILFIGSQAWKRGSDRACCILTIRAMQMAARSYQNIYGYEYGGRPYAEDGTQDIAQHLYRKGYIEQKLYDQASGTAKCPGGGSYNRLFPDIFPEAGTLYMTCSLAGSDQHEPSSHADW